MENQTYDYKTPVDPVSPWPTFRRDHRNTGCSPVNAHYQGDHPWHFQTGKGIFSTPVIDGAGTIFIGSADHYFYALNPDGSERWCFKTGELIDSAAALPASNGTDPRVIFPSGDGYLYCLKRADGSLVWQFDAREAPRADSYNNWWEANVAIGPDGNIYAGNTNFNYYALTQDGDLLWTYETGANAWSIAAFADDDTIVWGSCDTYIHGVSKGGARRWRRRTLGFISASAAVDAANIAYIGSFDSYFRAVDVRTGRLKWKFKTGDHIYASAALAVADQGNTTAIYFGSTDGIFYALSPQGKLHWTYDTGAPIRSSAVLGQAPEGEDGGIVYFGCGNGRVYALNTTDGSRRWSYDTTPDDPLLRDRNDLNGSPALSETGVILGGEHGQVWYVPYDYPIHNPDDPRGSTDPAEDLPARTASLFYVTPGGVTQLDQPNPLPAATIITLRLVVRENHETIHARLFNSPVGQPADALVIHTEPAFPFEAETSADGKYLHIIPQGFLEPGTDYQIHVKGNYYTGGLYIGNWTLGGRKAGRFTSTFSFTTTETELDALPLGVFANHVDALAWTRLAVPIPTMLPSLNQIGFDYMNWILGTVAVGEPDQSGECKLILWAIGGKHDENGILVADPDTDFTLPLSGTSRGDSFILSNRHFNMAVTGIPIPFNIFQLRGQMSDDQHVKPGATAYADARVLSIPTFGPLLVIAGLASNWWQKLFTTSTYMAYPYGSGPANCKPEGVTVAALDYISPTSSQAGRIVAALQLEPGASYPATAHRPGILLIDDTHMEAVFMDYHANLTSSTDQAGNLSSVELTIPADTHLPDNLKAVVMLDVYSAYEQTLNS